MTSPRLDASNALVADLTAIIAASDLEDKADITVTNRAGLVESASRHGCVFVDFPTLSSENFADLQPEFQVHIIGGTPTDELSAFARIDSIIQALHEGNLNIRSGEPGNWPTQGGLRIPAYTLTLNPLQ